MKKFRLINNIVGWIAFVIALTTYLLTIEPTASFWDCSEFISCAYRLDVGHPPGAPLFMIIGRFVSLFASSPTKVAMLINSISATFSALTILFLFWTITHLGRKIFVRNENEMTVAQIIGLMGAGLVGSLAYTFSDTFWFSAVEGEVYASSALFTAAVFWCILKWEDIADKKDSDRWLIFIAYLVGLSIGIHLLNLLAIPSIVLIYYFKNYKFSFKGTIVALLVSFLILASIMFGFISGSIQLACWFDLFFVNVLGCSFNTGAIAYLITAAIILSWAIYETYREKNDLRLKILFILSFIILGIPFIGGGFLIPIIVVAALIFWMSYKKLNRRVMNLILLSLTVLAIGYSTFTITVIRALANPSMDENQPDNVFGLKGYLTREQYGECPLFYGQYYNSEVKLEVKGDYCIPVSTEGETIWMKDTITSGKDHYMNAGKRTSPVYDDQFKTFFPRMYSPEPNHVEGYKSWGEIEGENISYDKCGRTITVTRPTFTENLRYFFRYQVNFMYWRYFMWNFSGRQNDIQGYGEVQNGNWITGINPIDKLLVGDQTNLPPDMANNKGHNKYYLLPLLLGIIGLVYQVYAGKKGMEGFIVTFILFFMTGLAIVIFLNQQPYQPRERDYAYAGSFYAFTIWIGLGVLALIKGLEKVMPKSAAAIIASLLALGVPVLMANQNWDDHNRSGRTTCTDFGYDYLMSCAPNAIIFTNGDNDTFPLWYNQEVEGVRTDVRVCNLSYLQTDWYIDQMKRGYYESAPLPIKMDKSKYAEGVRNVSAVNSKSSPIQESLIDKPIELGLALQFFSDDDSRAKDETGNNYMPSQNLYLKVDSAQVLKTGTVKSADAKRIIPILPIKLGNRLLKNDYAILDMLKNNNWERPIYYAVTVGKEEANIGLDSFTRTEGLAKRIVPLQPEEDGGINTDLMFDNMLHKFRWGGIENPKVYLDENNLRMCVTFRMLFSRLAGALIKEGKNQKAIETLDYCMKVLPTKTIPSDYLMIPIAEDYYRLGQKEKADKIMFELGNKTVKNLDWFFQLDKEQALSAFRDINQNLYVCQEIMSISDRYNKSISDKYYKKFVSYFQRYNTLK
jgi:hypothetical protein